MIGLCISRSNIVFFALILSSCVHAEVQTACIDKSSASLNVDVTNTTSDIINVPIDAPHIGSRSVDGLSIAITDARGNELKRCARSDNFGPLVLVPLNKSESKRYELSEQSIRAIYCDVDVSAQFISATYGSPNKQVIAISPSIQPIRLCHKTALAK